MKKYACMILLILMETTLASAVDLPFSLSLDTYADYSSYVGVSAADGSAVEHRTEGCWSGGCARFTPPNTYTTVDSRRANIGFAVSGSPSTFSVRWLWRQSANWEEAVQQREYGTQDKWLIVLTTAGTNNRYMSIYEQCRSVTCAGQDYYSPGICGDGDDNNCIYRDSIGYNEPKGDDAFKSEDWSEQWVAFEYLVNLSSQTSSLYIWTQDGTFNGLYHTATTGTIGGTVTAVEGLGHYFNGYYPTIDGVWFELDEIAVSTSYIGPPSGFVGGDPPAAGSTTIGSGTGSTTIGSGTGSATFN